MPINTLETATLFQKNLDLLAVQQMKTGWMDANAGQVIYSGGRDVKIPMIGVQGLGNYDRDNGYPMGSVNLEYETRRMTQDRGREFQLDAMDIDEAAFIPTAGTVMGEFQRTKVVPEIDAYRLAMLSRMAIRECADAAYNYVPGQSTSPLKALKEGIEYVRDNGYDGQLVIHATGKFMLELETELANKLTAMTWSQGGINTTVPSVDDCAIIKTPKNRMAHLITMLDGKTEGQKEGGFAAAEGAIYANFLIMPMSTPLAITKQDKMKIFSPDVNQKADAWLMNYRRFHELWVKENAKNSIYGNFSGAKPALTTPEATEPAAADDDE